MSATHKQAAHTRADSSKFMKRQALKHSTRQHAACAAAAAANPRHQHIGYIPQNSGVTSAAGKVRVAA